MSDARAYYDRYWADPTGAPPSSDTTTSTRKALLQAALQGLPTASRILDAGCGSGEFTEFLRTQGFIPVGIDLSSNAIECAMQRFHECEFRVGSPEQLADEFSGQFQAVWSSEVIEHIFDIYGFLTAVHRCLVPGGRLILTTPYHGLLKNLLLDLTGFAQHYRPFGGHIRFFNKASLSHCLNHCGFTVKKWAGIGRGWPFYKSFFVVAEKAGEPRPRPPADS